MSCDPEKVTGYVDDALEAAERAAIDVHLAECATCQQQVEEERDVRACLRALPSLEPRPAFEDAVRRRMAGRPRWGYWALPLAASLALLVLWTRGAAPFVAWELARDHTKCFGLSALPAKVWSDDARVIAAWFEEQGTALPLVPENVAGMGLVGARYCPLLDRFAAHLYYSGEDRHASIFVLKGPARFGDVYEGRARGETVLLFRSAGTVVGVVAGLPEDAQAFRRKFTTSMAALHPAHP
jgi:anti-sigma factor RsiW